MANKDSQPRQARPAKRKQAPEEKKSRLSVCKESNGESRKCKFISDNALRHSVNALMPMLFGNQTKLKIKAEAFDLLKKQLEKDLSVLCAKTRVLSDHCNRKTVMVKDVETTIEMADQDIVKLPVIKNVDSIAKSQENYKARISKHFAKQMIVFSNANKHK